MPPNTAKWLVITTSVLWAVLGTLAVMPAMFSVMMFDAPGSTENPATVTLALSLLTFPLVCAAAVVLSWIFLLCKAPSVACASAALPLLSLAVGGIALAWIMYMQNGQFAP